METTIDEAKEINFGQEKEQCEVKKCSKEAFYACNKCQYIILCKRCKQNKHRG